MSSDSFIYSRTRLSYQELKIYYWLSNFLQKYFTSLLFKFGKYFINKCNLQSVVSHALIKFAAQIDWSSYQFYSENPQSICRHRFPLVMIGRILIWFTEKTVFDWQMWF